MAYLMDLAIYVFKQVKLYSASLRTEYGTLADILYVCCKSGSITHRYRSSITQSLFYKKIVVFQIYFIMFVTFGIFACG